MDHDFGRVLAVTLAAGLIIVGVGTTMLFLAFRAVGEGRAGERRSIRLALALIAFVFVCCAIFFALTLR